MRRPLFAFKPSLSLHRTGWLDGLISERLTAERPEETLAVICGAVVKANLEAVACAAEFKRVLEKGQVPAKELLNTVFQVEFIYESALPHL